MTASGAVAGLVVLSCVVGLVAVYVVPTPAVVEPAVFALVAGVVLLAGLVAVRVAHGALSALDGDGRPEGVELAVASLEAALAAVCVAGLVLASLLAAGTEPGLGDAVTGGVVLLVGTVGVGLALASLGRAAIVVSRGGTELP